jgi:hypothetical protein
MVMHSNPIAVLYRAAYRAETYRARPWKADNVPLAFQKVHSRAKAQVLEQVRRNEGNEAAVEAAETICNLFERQQRDLEFEVGQ